MTILLYAGLFLASVIITLAGCHLFTNGIEWLGKRLHISEGAVGSVFAAVGTTLPETSIPIIAIFFGAGREQAEVGWARSSARRLCSARLSCRFWRSCYCSMPGLENGRPPSSSIMAKCGSISYFSSSAYVLALTCAVIPSRLFHGPLPSLLIGLYVYYMRLKFQRRMRSRRGSEPLEPFLFARRSSRPSYVVIAPQGIVGLLGLVGGAHLFVTAANSISAELQVSPLILALLIAPLATELPEMSNSFLWLYRKKDRLAVGNVTGAMVFQGMIPVSVGLLGTGMGTGNDGLGDHGAGRIRYGHQFAASAMVRSVAPLVAERQRHPVPWVHTIPVHAWLLNASDESSNARCLGLTMGDPAGIGPEVIAKALADKALARMCRPVVVGSRAVMERTIASLQAAAPDCRVRSDAPRPTESRAGGGGGCSRSSPLPRFRMGVAADVTGAASIDFIKAAVQLAQAGSLAGIVTAPINKEAMNMAGYHYPGHTELLADLTQTKEFGMMIVGGPLKIMFTTTHVAINSLSSMLTTERITKAIRLAHLGLTRYFGIARPKIGVAALNPHAGEHGLFGNEEMTSIDPAVRQARAAGIKASDPLPADTLFGKAARGAYDGVVAMYHDQGLIPLKLLAFGTCVNLTVGLPIIRTSVDHGTAYDIAGKGLAEHGSLLEAVKVAARLAQSWSPPQGRSR